MKRFYEEFKGFINKGNLLGIAVGFVIGLAFAAVITAFVDNVVMPIIAIPFGKPSFDQVMVWTINDSVIRFGSFITALVTFIAIAFTLFLILKAYNKATKGEATAPAGEVVILGQMLEEIRGLREDTRGRGGPPAV